jgi:hypothetical protein
MNLRITADADTLLRQAGHTAEHYLGDALESIDRRLGAGYAAKHPDLIAAFMHVLQAQRVRPSALIVWKRPMLPAVSSWLPAESEPAALLTIG